ncbi:IS110 family transposase [Pseudobacteroides cellulosolvens]|uniref:Transposase IS111A/IS1328/IS1533 n=1 Tax=Pseudobacteroides cellulosolvens ATCC 35603 = DSM 2933 TaxID=398512 RepID=A0A0L6JWN4_9FIRM|nr:IS110 family transposase [Pseudobacteroides cellulosolvens]KNY30256.1 transposase IS111A/IS1328/IS1533 [Pseudobacteroides cellulosolvens ATCC 35603 = DSM 2933]
MNNVPVAGIDVGKFFSEMAILSPSNEMCKRMKITHCMDDFNKALDLLKKAENEFNEKPVIVMESTGHYFKLLSKFLNNNGYEVVVANPIQTNSIKNISIRKVKNDKVDAKKIALLYRLGELNSSNLPDDDITALRCLCRQYYDLVRERTAYKNRLIGIVDQIMLNYKDVFSDLCCETSLELLENYPTPDHIIKADKSDLINIMAKVSGMGEKWATKKYDLLILKAREFQPLSISSFANTVMLKNYISIIRTMNKSIDEILKSINNYIVTESFTVVSEDIRLLSTIPGIGTLTAATIVGEIGDIRRFNSPKKLTAFFGLDASVCQSGEFIGTKNHISKRGSRLLRQVLYTSVLTSIGKKSNREACNPVLYKYYHDKCINKRKMVALVAVMHKLVFFIYAVLRDKKPFELRTPEEHIKMLAERTISNNKEIA